VVRAEKALASLELFRAEVIRNFKQNTRAQLRA
jgi:hypothetical protein